MMPGGLANHPEAISFARALQDHHLEEFGFLLGHRAVQLRLGRWRATAKIERRMAAHAAAVAAHGRSALDVAAQALASDDSSLRAGAAYALAALGDAERRVTIFSDPAVGTDDEIVSALALAPTSALVSDIEGHVAAGNDSVALLAAKILGKRRETPLKRLINLVATVDSNAVFAELAVGLARMGSRSAWPVLYSAARRNPLDARVPLAMSVANDPEGPRLARARLARPSGPLTAADRRDLVRAVALGGDASDVALIAIHAREAPADVLPALGLLGYAEAVAAIMPYLESTEGPARRAAGLALETLTGGGLLATPLPDEDDNGAPDDEDPMVALDASVLPVCTDPAAWRSFWNTNSARFSDRRKRYRRGRVWSAAAALEALRTLPLSLAQRQLEADELSARTGLPTLEADWFLPRQEQHFASNWKTMNL
jgi:HEAT repeat protein